MSHVNGSTFTTTGYVVRSAEYTQQILHLCLQLDLSMPSCMLSPLLTAYDLPHEGVRHLQHTSIKHDMSQPIPSISSPASAAIMHLPAAPVAHKKALHSQDARPYQLCQHTSPSTRHQKGTCLQ